MTTAKRPERMNVPPLTKYRLALTLAEVASLLGVGYGRIFTIKTEDATFPTPVMLPGAQIPKYLRAEVVAWLSALPRAPRREERNKGGRDV